MKILGNSLEVVSVVRFVAQAMAALVDGRN
jgi:hypothetical protein